MYIVFHWLGFLTKKPVMPPRQKAKWSLFFLIVRVKCPHASMIPRLPIVVVVLLATSASWTKACSEMTQWRCPGTYQHQRLWGYDTWWYIMIYGAYLMIYDVNITIYDVYIWWYMTNIWSYMFCIWLYTIYIWHYMILCAFSWFNILKTRKMFYCF